MERDYTVLHPGSGVYLELGVREVGVETANILIIVAVLLGPILAVQVQKAVERSRERENRKSWVFHNLMATRAARLSADHVQALNMIDLVFYGRRILGIHRRSKTEVAVLDAWHEYHDHLNTNFNQKNLSLWATKRDDLFINLLSALAVDVGYRFDRVKLRKGSYSPIAHEELELDQQQIRKKTIELLSGSRPLKMEITEFPVHEKALKSQLELQEKLAAALDGHGQLSVKVVPEADAQQGAQTDGPAPDGSAA